MANGRTFRPGPRIEYRQPARRFEDDTLETIAIDATPPLDVAYGVGGTRWRQTCSGRHDRTAQACYQRRPVIDASTAIGTVTGTVAVTLDNFTSTASGSEVVGTSTPTLANATSAATGVHGVSGMSASTLAPFTSTASGSETLGSLARTLANFTSSAAGTFGQIYTITGHLTTSRADTRRTTERVDGSRTTEGVR